MNILQTFGIDPLLLAAQIVNFLVILWLLKKFAYKPIFDMLEKRRSLISDGVSNAEKANKALEKALDEEKQILKNAQAEAQSVLSDAQQQASEIVMEAETSAKVRVEKILDDAKKEIERQTAEAQKQLAAHTTRLAIDILEKSLKGMVDAKTQKEVVESATKKLRA